MKFFALFWEKPFIQKGIAMKILSAVLLTLLTACAASVPDEKPVEIPVAAPEKPANKADYMTAQENEIRALAVNPAFTVKRRKNILIVTLTGKAVFAQNSYRVEAQIGRAHV